MIAHHSAIVRPCGQVVHLPLLAEGMQVQPADANPLGPMNALPHRPVVSIPHLRVKAGHQHVTEKVATAGVILQVVDVPHVGPWHCEGGCRHAAMGLDVVVEGGNPSCCMPSAAGVEGMMAKCHLTAVRAVFLGVWDHWNLIGLCRVVHLHPLHPSLQQREPKLFFIPWNLVSQAKPRPFSRLEHLRRPGHKAQGHLEYGRFHGFSKARLEPARSCKKSSKPQQVSTHSLCCRILSIVDDLPNELH